MQASEMVLKNGRSDWIRTSDPQTPSLMRYQAALRSDAFFKERYVAYRIASAIVRARTIATMF
jgi:hypothetical protein